MINSTFGGFMTARQGMAAAQHGLNLTGHNLTNSATEGYTRQRIDQVSINYSGHFRYASKYNVMSATAYWLQVLPSCVIPSWISDIAMKCHMLAMKK